jgi:hypothetical protein
MHWLVSKDCWHRINAGTPGVSTKAYHCQRRWLKSERIGKASIAPLLNHLLRITAKAVLEFRATSFSIKAAPGRKDFHR